jgi:hypothetical protein
VGQRRRDVRVVAPQQAEIHVICSLHAGKEEQPRASENERPSGRPSASHADITRTCFSQSENVSIMRSFLSLT